MLTSLLAALLIGLASYRAWRVLAVDSIGRPVLVAVLNRCDNGSRWASWTLKLITCPWCLGFWYAGAGTLYVFMTMELAAPLLVWFAASFVCGVAAKQLGD